MTIKFNNDTLILEYKTDTIELSKEDIKMVFEFSEFNENNLETLGEAIPISMSNTAADIVCQKYINLMKRIKKARMEELPKGEEL